MAPHRQVWGHFCCRRPAWCPGGPDVKASIGGRPGEMQDQCQVQMHTRRRVRSCAYRRPHDAYRRPRGRSFLLEVVLAGDDAALGGALFHACRPFEPPGSVSYYTTCGGTSVPSWNAPEVTPAAVAGAVGAALFRRRARHRGPGRRQCRLLAAAVRTGPSAGDPGAAGGAVPGGGLVCVRLTPSPGGPEGSWFSCGGDPQ